MDIKFKVLDGYENLIPKRAHKYDAAFDIMSRIEIIIKPHKVYSVPTSLFLELPKFYEAQVRSRSGLAFKYGIFVINSPGTIDAGYRGEISVLIYNLNMKDYNIKIGERIAQLVIVKLSEVDLIKANTIEFNTDRGKDGFGSSGKF